MLYTVCYVCTEVLYVRVISFRFIYSTVLGTPVHLLVTHSLQLTVFEYYCMFEYYCSTYSTVLYILLYVISCSISVCPQGNICTYRWGTI